MSECGGWSDSGTRSSPIFAAGKNGPRKKGTTGGRISRPQKEIFQEAADLAYYFHWPRTEIMAMTGKERGIWLEQIRRIHSMQKQQRDDETAAQLNFFMDNRQNDVL